MSPSTNRLMRQIHQYLGLFFAPAILFFAFTGGLQTFGLHENRSGGPHEPPAWLVTAASLHKDQQLPHPKPPKQPKAAGEHHDHDHASPEKPNYASGPLKIFVGLLAVGLILSTLLGVYIGLKNRSARTGSLIALGLGVVAPIALIWVSTL